VTTFSYDALPGRIVFGAGASRSRLAGELAGLGAQRVLLVVAVAERALAAELTGSLGDVVAATYDGVRPHVPVETVDAARAVAARARADAVLAIGGGSTTGLAKAVALRTGLPVVAVPTTYAGSEVTPVWGMTESARKTTGRSMAVLPRVVIYDPELTTTLPVGLTVSSAGNALAHCVEALYGPGANPVTDLMAVEGIRAVADGLPAVVASPTDVVARERLLYAAYLAGSAFAVAGSGLHHKICHALGGAYDLPHAELHTVVLPHVAAFNETAPAARLGRAARALDAPTVSAGLARLLGGVHAPRSLRDLGLDPRELPAAVALVMAKDLGDNPRPVHAEDVEAILRGAIEGTAPAAAPGLALAGGLP